MLRSICVKPKDIAERAGAPLCYVKKVLLGLDWDLIQGTLSSQPTESDD